MSEYINDSGRQLRQIGGGLGAITVSGAAFDYRAAAQTLASSTFASVPLTSYVVVALEADGANPLVKPFNDQTSAADAFEAIYNVPGKYAYAALFTPDGPTQEQFFAVVQLFGYKITTEMLKSALPWFLGGVAVIGGVLYYTRKKPAGRLRSRARVRRVLARHRRRSR